MRMHQTTVFLIDKNDRFVVSGVLNFLTVMTLWETSIPLMAECSEIKMDLSQVIKANSAGLALLLEWKRFCTVKKQKIFFLNVPEQLHSIAKAAGVDFLLK